jgi:hypothetical protein
MSYRKAICHHCKKGLIDPDDDPLYVVPDDKYYCNQECYDKHNTKGHLRAKKQKEQT